MQRIIFLTFFILSGAVTIAQDLSGKSVDSIFAKYGSESTDEFQHSPYYIISIDKNMASSEVRVIRHLNEDIAIAEISDPEELKFLKTTIRIQHANDEWKLSPPAEQNFNNSKYSRKFILTALSLDSLIEELKKHPSYKISSIDEPSNSLIITVQHGVKKNDLIGLRHAVFIDVVVDAHPEIGIIGYDRSFHGINAVDYIIPGANGKNIVVGVKEQKMQELDLDIWKRVLPSQLASTNITNHATVIASIIGGAGNSFYDGRGIAWGVRFFPSSFANLFPDDAAVLNANKVTVQNHSYGTVIQQFYGAEAMSYDVQTWANKNLLHVFSAGNQGISAASEGKYINLPGYANLTANFKMAKNVITVGAIDNKGNIPAESSAGPLYDGRLGPQIIALGPNGTSDAAAMVSGTIAVIQQVYADSNSQLTPEASLIKAVLYNTAEDIYNPGIDYKTGYGLLDSYNAIRSIQQKKYEGASISQGQSWTRTITVPPNAEKIKVTLAWPDSAAQVNTNKVLINDLDLELTSLATGVIYKPWVLSQAANADSLAKLPSRRRDSLNTAEQISVRLPAGGSYEIKVKGTSIVNAAVPFHVSFNIDTLNTFYFTSPQHSSDVNRQENATLTVRWKTFVADTNQTGNLYISYDRGTNWNLIKASQKIYSNQYQWPIKDTTSTAVLKMETSFGSFNSKEFIISPVLRPVVDFLCTDSFRLSWNKHVYANAYRIWTLTDSPYLKNIFNIPDTFVVLNRTIYPWKVYAVEPLLNNGIPASRSVAFDIEKQGVHCFYKTLNYNLLDLNKAKLILELSVTNYIDSVFFEKVNISGQLFQTYGGVRVTNGVFIYNQFVDEMASGTTYVRSKIKLKSGQIVYTEIIAITTSGKQVIVFYPNPADRNTPLQIVFRQGLPADASIRFYDVSGRLLKKYSSLSSPLNISSFSNGIIIYIVVDGRGGFLGAGKILLQ